ncbi:MAG: hypothetical protein HYV29_09430 [Ignavibacteriales bacterium]|nr:hypothetical protein [Ignavibacteriales bacterium]
MKVKKDSSKYSGYFTQHIYTTKNSEIAIYNDNSHENMLMKASIADNIFPLKHGIKIGIKREEFFKRLNWLASSDFDSISYNDGTGDTYLDIYFRKNRLLKLVFDFTK